MAKEQVWEAIQGSVLDVCTLTCIRKSNDEIM
jgi:hypothetical protein